MNRRELLKTATVLGGGAQIARLLPPSIARGYTLAQQTLAPTGDLDATWGKGFMQPDVFVTIVYNTL